jgi:HAD superfamily hydrolase (TIGR01509 family)
MAPEFLYFDLGKVLVDFDLDAMRRQVAALAGIAEHRVSEVLFESELQRRYEAGQISSREFYESFCAQTGTRPDYDQLARAASDYFCLNASMVPVVTELRAAGYRMGILSNTCPIHWEHIAREFPILTETFAVHALSYRIGAMKPDAAIFHAAARMAGVPPESILFVDDVPAHVAGAQAVGFDAVRYTSTPAFQGELLRRGIRLGD